MRVSASAADDPVKVVRNWYEIVRNASWVEAGYGGTLGGPERYHRAYLMLAPNFRATVSETAFLSRFANTAYIRLDQAELIEAQGEHATVFVEDQRDMVLNDLPATVRFYGSVSLVREAEGWAIDGFHIAPEASMIALRDFGHGSEGYIFDTSMVTIGQYLGVGTVDWKKIHVPRKIFEGPVTVTYSNGHDRISLELAKLYSGMYVPLIVRDLSPRGRQPRIVFYAPSEEAGAQYCPTPWCTNV